MILRSCAVTQTLLCCPLLQRLSEAKSTSARHAKLFLARDDTRWGQTSCHNLPIYPISADRFNLFASPLPEQQQESLIACAADTPAESPSFRRPLRHIIKNRAPTRASSKVLCLSVRLQVAGKRWFKIHDPHQSSSRVTLTTARLHLHPARSARSTLVFSAPVAWPAWSVSTMRSYPRAT